MLLESQLEEAVRAGDCLALLVEHFYDTGDSSTALRYIREMNARKINVSAYIDTEILDDLLKGSKMTDHASVHGKRASTGNEDENDDIGEDIEQV